MNFLHREEAPFGEDTWKKIDEIVVKTARESVVGRKFIEITQVLDPSIQSVPYDVIETVSSGACGIFGENGCDTVSVKHRKFLPAPQIYKDFKIHWRDIESFKNHGIPLDFSVVAAAAREVSKAEDKFIFHGDAQLGYPGLLNVEGKEEIKKSDFSKNGGIFETGVRCIEKLIKNGFNGNFAFVLNPSDYSKGFRLYGNSGVLEINQLKEIFDLGVFSSFAVPKGTALAISSNIENLDLFLIQDMITGYLSYENMDHYFRVFEIIALRIKNPSCICVGK